MSARPNLPDDFQAQGVEDLDKLRPSPTNPRKHFPPEEISALAESFRTAGVLTPLLVRPISTDKPATWSKGKWQHVEHFEICDGERRYRAANEAGLQAVPVIVRNLTDEQVRVIQLITFAQRADLKPSEEAAAYQGLAAAGKTAEAIAAEVGKPLSFVRSLLRLGKLPPWALASVDQGILPRATAELIARVPGEASREKAAACVLLADMWPASADVERAKKASGDTLSYRDTRELIQQNFTRELKAAPFDRKSLTLLPNAGSCDTCPSRAGNNEEATADGVRADTCMDPDCFRAKETAYREQVAKQAEAKNILPADLEQEGFDKPPRGWCRPDAAISETELSADFAGYQGESLAKKLGKDLPQKYFAWGKGGKVVYLVKTGEARKALVAAGVLKKPEPRKKDTQEKTRATAPLIDAVDIHDRAVSIGAKILGEYGVDLFAELADLNDAAPSGPIHDGLRFITEYLIRDHHAYGDERARAVADTFECSPAAAAEKLAKMDAASLLSTCLRLIAYPVLDTAKDRDSLLNWAEMDWEQLTAQAQRELNSGKTVDEKIAKAEIEQTKPPTGTLEHSVWMACHCFADADKRWDKLRKHGATDAELRAQLEQEIGECGGSSGPGYQVGYKKLKLWHGKARHDGKPTLEGAALVGKAREVLGIPQKAKASA